MVANKAPALLEYSEDTYVGRPQRRRASGRKNPPFPITLWNVKDKWTGGFGRTSNKINGWHNKISKFVGVKSSKILVGSKKESGTKPKADVADNC